MSDFHVQVGGDFSELLRGFAQLESRAQQAGTAVGKGIGDGIQGFSSRSLTALNAELNRLQQRQTRVAVDSTAFEKTGQKIREVQALIAAVERRRIELNINERSINGLQARLAQLQAFQLTLDVDTREFIDAQRQIDALQKDLTQISQKKILIDADANSALAKTARLQNVLQGLQDKQLRIDVDSAEFAVVTRDIERISTELRNIERQKLLINADPSSLVALRSQLGELQGQLERVAIGSQRFEELSAAIRQTEKELAKAGASTDQFRILDGVVQGIAFSLSNAVVGGAQQAIAAMGGLVSEFARLDTELRKAAAASGETGAYDSLSRSVEQVGIEAAGTTLEVAQLVTELVRGGMTVNQANASLGAIVRGAEATGTGFADMGSVVSASLKGFGLEAKDAQRVVDALVQGANASAASVSGMGMAFKYAAPVARILGVSVEGLGITIGLLTNAGIDASEAGVTLRNGFSKLASAAPRAGGAVDDLTGQAAQAAKTMRSLGVDIYNANGTLRPMPEVLLKLKGAFEKLDPASKINLAEHLFGGADDGPKWLALLNQSEAEINKMANAMANTKGVTDTARDAMQGFEMKLKALDGSIGAIGNTLGSVAAAGLMPFVDAANLIVGAIVALPGPVKTVAAGITLLTGAYVAATVAQIAFAKAMGTVMVQEAIAGVTAMAGALRTQLAGGATVAVVALDAMVNAIRGFSAQAFFAAIAQVAAGIRTQLAGAATVAMVAFDKLAGAIRSGAFAAAAKDFIGKIGTIAAGALRFAAVVAPIAIGIGIVAKAMEGSREASDRYKRANDTISEALVKLREELGKTEVKIVDSRNVLQQLWDSFSEGSRVMGDINATNAVAKSIGELTAKSTAYLATLASTEKLTDEQRTKANAYVVALQNSGDAVRQLAKEYTVLADKAELSGDKRQTEVYREAATLLNKQADAANNASAALTKKTAITTKEMVAMGVATEAVKKRADAEKQLSAIIANAPVRALDSQLAAGKELLSLSQALAAREQSRFDITKATGQYELQKAQDAGASEAQLNRIREANRQVEFQALQAKADALARQQAIEVRLLEINQRKAQIEANLGVIQAKNDLLEEQSQLAAATAKNDAAGMASASLQVQLKQQALGIAQENVTLLGQTQPLERAIANATNETAINSLKAEAAGQGFYGTVANASAATAALGQGMSTVEVVSRRAADGSIILSQQTTQAATATQSAANAANRLTVNFQSATTASSTTATNLGAVETAASDAATASSTMNQQLSNTAGKTGNIGDAAKSSAGKFGDLTTAVNDTAEAARIGANLAIEFSKASGSIGGIANAMASAAKSAREFYDTLAKASGLPGARWAGGSVDAGQTVRINDGPAGRSLGQESFITAAGKLSLINRPANSLWTAPTSGTVIPAGITAGLKDRGMFDAPRSSRPAASKTSARLGTDSDLAATVARQAVAIGKLQQSVDRLVEKDWNVQVRVRNNAGGASHLDMLNRMR